jgi:hypothetical protein
MSALKITWITAAIRRTPTQAPPFIQALERTLIRPKLSLHPAGTHSPFLGVPRYTYGIPLGDQQEEAIFGDCPLTPFPPLFSSLRGREHRTSPRRLSYTQSPCRGRYVNVITSILLHTTHIPVLMHRIGSPRELSGH